MIVSDTYAIVGLRDTFRHDFLVTLLVTRVTAILTLISHSVQQELVAEGAENDLVELALNEFMAVHFMDFILALADSGLTGEASGSVQRALAQVLLD